MTTLAIEINDAGLLVAGESGVLETEPGYASFERGEIVTGSRAYAQARLRPRQVSNRYWADLSLETGTAGLEGVGSAAELAYAQLEALWGRFRDDADDAVLVVPGTYTREQLGLLLGLAQECGMPVRAMVDAAVAASGQPFPGRQLVHADAGLHRVLVTTLEQDEEVAARPGQGLEEIGLAHLADLLAKRVAELFVLSTRFDPFHRAETEQILYDRLPGWLRSVHSDGRAALELDYADERFRVEVERDQLLGVCTGFYRMLVQLIAQSREAGQGLVVQVSSRLAELPGLAGELTRLDDAQIVSLPPGKAALGAIRSLDALAGHDEHVRLLKRLPWREEPAELAEAPVAEAPSARRETGATHVVYRGIARGVGAEGLAIGREPDASRRGIVLEGRHGGVSRSHCELVMRDGQLQLLDSSRHGTFVNEKRVAGQVALQPGDVIRIGSPGEELRVIKIAHEHGT